MPQGQMHVSLAIVPQQRMTVRYTMSLETVA